MTLVSPRPFHEEHQKDPSSVWEVAQSPVWWGESADTEVVLGKAECRGPGVRVALGDRPHLT